MDLLKIYLQSKTRHMEDVNDVVDELAAQFAFFVVEICL